MQETATGLVAVLREADERMGRPLGREGGTLRVQIWSLMKELLSQSLSIWHRCYEKLVLIAATVPQSDPNTEGKIRSATRPFLLGRRLLL